MTVSPNYRMHVIARLPRLKMLDNREVIPPSPSSPPPLPSPHPLSYAHSLSPHPTRSPPRPSRAQVRQSERDAASSVVSAEADQMRVLFSNALLERKLTSAWLRIAMHAELLTAVHSGRFSRGRSPPAPPVGASMDTRRYLEYLDIESVTPSERDIVMDAIRSEVRRARMDLLQRSDAAQAGASAYHVYRTMVSTSAAVRDAGRRAATPEW